MKKIFFTFFVSLFLFTNISISEAIFSWSGEGSGIESDPFQIENCERLQSISEVVESGYYFILNNDIDCSMTNPNNSNWDSEGLWAEGIGFYPLGGNSRNQFFGYFDGNNKKIKNLYINRPDPNLSGDANDLTGLFGYVGSDSEIKNVYLTEANITGVNQLTGGLVGSNFEGTIKNSYVSGSITGGEYTGGLVGYNLGHIENSYTKGTVNGSNNVGGLVGQSSPPLASTVKNSYSEASVSGIENVGGLIGKNYQDSVINSYSTGVVQGNNAVGGFIGHLFYNYGATCSDYVSNSGWLKNQENISLETFGEIKTSEMFVGIVDGNCNDVNIYIETDKSNFYSKNHGVYAIGTEDAWDFSSPIWYEWNNKLPLFEEQIIPKTRTRSSGSSASAIASFQKEQIEKAKENLPSPKITPPVLSRIIRMTIPRTIGEDVLAFQKYLNSIGYNVGPEDGIYGPQTQRAVINFQTINNLSPDGSIGPLTRALMQ